MAAKARPASLSSRVAANDVPFTAIVMFLSVDSWSLLPPLFSSLSASSSPDGGVGTSVNSSAGSSPEQATNVLVVKKKKNNPCAIQ